LTADIAIWGWVLAVLVHSVVFIIIAVFTIVVLRVLTPLTAPVSILSVPTSGPGSALSISGLSGSVADWW
jgi:hypothetical protein